MPTIHHEVPPKVVYIVDPSEAKPLRTLTQAMRAWATYWASQTGADIQHALAGPR